MYFVSTHLSTVGSPEGLLAIKTNDFYAREPGKITAFTGKIIEKSIKSIDFAVKVSNSNFDNFQDAHGALPYKTWSVCLPGKVF